MRKRTTGFNPCVFWFSIKLALMTTTVFLCWEMGDQRSSLAQVENSAQDIPEEMLQTQITTEASSPLTGLAQSATRRATEQKQLQVAAAEVPPLLTPSIYRSVELLRLRKLLKNFLPFF
jgi:hypothetical protein